MKKFFEPVSQGTFLVYTQKYAYTVSAHEEYSDSFDQVIEKEC